MKRPRQYLLLIILPFFLTSMAALLSQTPASDSETRWYKGNTHTHTLNSDGDSTPDEVVRWYREHGYQFLVLTDHNFLTSVDALNALHGADEQFLVIKGEEVTDRFGKKAIHINGLNVSRLVEPQDGGSLVERVQNNVNEIRAADGIPHINHPNYAWSITAADLQRVENYKLFEIYNGHPAVNNLGGGGLPGLEEMWDMVLSSGKEVYGIAVDDAHHFKRPWDSAASRPGQGWVVVKASSLTPEAILTALESGNFYASTGVLLKDYSVDENRIVIDIDPGPEWMQTRFLVQFIGKDGKILQESFENQAIYEFSGNEQYVRAKIIDANGNFAWTQPVFP